MSKLQPLATRTISADPGLLSPEELLKSHKDGRRRTLEELIAQQTLNASGNYPRAFIQRCRENVRWFLDSARLKLSVSWHSIYFDDMG